MKAIRKEKRPQDWRLGERLEMIISCGTLDDKAVSELCRSKGLYPHHIKQWKREFVSGAPASTTTKTQPVSDRLKHGIKDLKRELNRKDKALAETAALLVLQKSRRDLGNRRRQLIVIEERCEIVRFVNEAR